MGNPIDDFINEGHCASSSKTNQYSSCGMTLRDYFAAKFIAGRAAIPGDVDAQYDAALAYKVADAMIVERAK